MLVAPAALMLAAGPAQADCTPSAGTLITPTNGSTVTCDTTAPNPFIAQQIGDGSTNATVEVEANAVIDTSTAFGNRSIFLSSATVTLADNAEITELSSGDGVIRTFGDATVELNGTNSRIKAGGSGIISNNDADIELNGDNARIEAAGAGILTFNDAAVALNGDNVLIVSDTTAIVAVNTATVTIGANAQIIADNDDDSAAQDGINGQGGTIVSHGLIQTGSTGTSGDHSIEFTGGASNDSVTLHTGSNLLSPNGADLGGGTDTLTLEGNNSEDEEFLNLENIVMNGTSWTLSNTLDVDNITINSGTLSDAGGALTTDALTLNGTGAALNNGVEGIEGNAGGGDTITLQGAGSEDDALSGFETLNIDANATGWTMTGNTNFTDMNLNSGKFTIGSSDFDVTGSVDLANNTELVIASGVTFDSAQIGDGSTDFTLTLEDGASIDLSGVVNWSAALVQNGTVNLGDNSSVIDTDAGDSGIYASFGDLNITLGDNVRVEADSSAIAAEPGTNNITTGSNAEIISHNADAIYTDGTPVIADIGANSEVRAENFAITSNDADITATIRSGTLVVGDSDGDGDGNGIHAEDGNHSVVIYGAVRSGSDGGAGGDHSLFLDGNDSSLTLHTGSNLESPNGADLGRGDDSDTLTLEGNNTEDELFLNVETVEVNADDTGWTLASDSTFNDINVNTGLFKIGAGNTLTINNLMTIDNGATFGGTGQAGGHVTNNGTVAPGNSIGTTVIGGNFTQGAGGELVIELDDGGQIDLLTVTGNANLDGTLSFTTIDGDFTTGTPLTFMTAAAVNGSFATIDTSGLNLGSLYDVTVVVDTTSTITIEELSTASLIAGSNVTSGNAAAGLDAGFAADPTGTAGLKTAINNLGSTAAIDDAINSASGTVRNIAVESASTAMAKSAATARGRMSAARGGASGVSSGNEIKGPNVTWWMEGLGGFGQIETDSVARGAEYDVWGAAAGAEKQISAAFLAGLYASWSDVESEINGLDDRAESDVYQLGLYTSWQQGRFVYDGLLAGSYMSVDTLRPTSTGNAQGEYDGWGLHGQIRAGVEVRPPDPAPVPDVLVMPYFGAEASVIGSDDYRETGAGVQNMRFEAATTTTVNMLLGAEISGDFDLPRNFTFRPAIDIAWAHNFADQNSRVNSAFTVSPTATAFTGEGPERNRDAARIGLGLALEAPGEQAFTTYAGYNAHISGDHDDHAFTAGLKLHW